MAKRQRTLLAYSMHARTQDGVIDYVEFFQALMDQSLIGLRFGVADEMVSVTSKRAEKTAEERNSGAGALRFVAGSATDLPLFYNDKTGRDEVIELAGGHIVNAVWTFVDPANRMLVTERKRPGVGIGTIARYFELLGRELGYRKLRFDLNPSPSSEFAGEVARLTNITSAEITLSRPNLDWGDTEADIHEYADKSDASKAKIEMTAARGSYLSRAHGIVHDVMSLARRPITSLKDVAVTGRAPEDSAPKRLSLQRFQRKAIAAIPSGASPDTEFEVLEGPARDLIAAASTDQQAVTEQEQSHAANPAED
jgi:hypothetical protein